MALSAAALLKKLICWNVTALTALRGFKRRFGGGGPIKFVTIDSRKFFMFFVMGFVVFLVYV